MAGKSAMKALADDASMRGAMKDSGKTAAELDAARRTNMAYEYLCHLEEARKWMEACLKIDLPPASELEQALRNGVYVAKLAMFFSPEVVKQKHIYDFDESVYKEHGLRFRHTDNISRWTNGMRSVKFPEIFYPEVTDLYDKKNMPRVIYCIHALSRFLFQLGIAPKMKDLHGIAQFTEEEINAMDRELEKAGVQMPTFGAIGGVLAKELGQDTGTLDSALAEIKAAVDAGDEARLLTALRLEAAGITDVEDAAAGDYMRQLAALGTLTQDNVQNAVDLGNKAYLDRGALEKITAAVQAGDVAALLKHLREAPWGMQDIDDDAGAAYLAALKSALAKGPLTPESVKSTITSTNAAHKKDLAVQSAMAKLNAAIDLEESEPCFAALNEPVLAFTDVDPAGAMQYHLALKALKMEKDRDVSRDEVQQCVTQANATAEDNAKHAAAIFALHEAVRVKSTERTLAALQDPYCHVANVSAPVAPRYLSRLSATLSELEAKGPGPSQWRQFKSEDGRTYYYNKQTNVTQWVAPIDEVVMTLDQVQQCVDSANADDARWNQLTAAQPTIVQLQARIRGYLARQSFRARLDFLNGQDGTVRKIQAHVRGLQQRTRYRDRLQYFRDNVAAVVRIQAAWKGMRARRQYENLTKVANPPVATVRRFLHLLDQSDADLAEELDVQQLKEKVMKEIKQNVQLEQDLNQMDIKIGLLVKNRISLEDVVKQSRLLKRQQRAGQGSSAVLLQSATGIQALNKDARRKLESYQHLFYLLQTQPVYLARLIFVDVPLDVWSGHKAQNFLLKLTETVYNYASNAREEYLLFKLFRTALNFEVADRITSCKDFVTGNPTVIRLVTAHNRSSSSGNYLAKVLGPVVKSLLADEDLDFTLDPVELYRSWLGRQEVASGQKSALPYDVTRDVALSHEAVRTLVDQQTKKVLGICARVQNAITSSVDDLPYGLRSVCQELSSTLRKRFPNEGEDDIIKVIGNLLYYRFVNPALIAPDAFDVIEVQSTDTISALHRKTFGQIAKILQHAAAGQVFEEEGDSPLNLFLRTAWVNFRKFFLAAAAVPSLEEHFHIDEYSEAVLLSRPAIVISFNDMYWLHRMVIANLAHLAPEEADPLREIVNDLGPLGDEVAELGVEDSPEFVGNKADMSLTLVNKFEVPEQEDSSIKALFVRTKRMLVDVIRFRQGKNLPDVLSGRPTADEEAAYKQFIERRRKEADKAKARAPDDAPAPVVALIFGSLGELLEKVLANVQVLVKEGMCRKDNNYQDLLNAVAQDIRNQRMYRRQRKQELARLKATLAELHVKQENYAQTIQEYESYVNECKKHVGKARPRKQGVLGGLFRSSKAAEGADNTWTEGRSVKYTALRLKEKGVLISIDGVTDAQLRHVTIEITAREKGVFEVSASSMLTSKEKQELLLEYLLELQYQNTPTTKLFDGMCVVNVNLLLFLINKKFLGSAK